MDNRTDLRETGLIQLNGMCIFERYDKKLALKSITNILESECFAANCIWCRVMDNFHMFREKKGVFKPVSS